jgi:hypothetical protein
MSRSWGHSAAGRIRSIEESNDPSRIEPATFRLVAYCLNELRYRVPPSNFESYYKATFQIYVKKKLFQQRVEELNDAVNIEFRLPCRKLKFVSSFAWDHYFYSAHEGELTHSPTCTVEHIMSYVFIGVGFPMHRDLIWSIVRPL